MNLKNSISNLLDYRNYTKAQKNKFIVLSIMTIIVVLVRTWTISTYWLTLPIILNSIFMFCGFIDEFEFLMYSMIMPSELFNFLGIGIAGLSWILKILRGKITIQFDKRDKWLCVLIIFMIISGIVSSIVNKTILSAVLSLGYIFIMLFIFKLTSACKYSIVNIAQVFKNILIIQILMMIIQFFNYGIFQPSDSYAGTFVNAHRLCVWLIWYLVVIAIMIKNKKYIDKNDIVNILVILIMIYLTDGKHIVVSAIGVLILWFVIDKIKYLKDRKILTTGLMILLTLYSITNISHIPSFKNNIESKSQYIYRYIYEPPYNNKFHYFDKTINEELIGYELLLGYGPGQYGSRVANLRAYEYMAKEDSLAITLSKIIPPHIVEPYKQFAEQYNEEYLAFVKDMSAVLSYPFSSIMAIIGELGVLGYLIYLMFFNSIEKYSNNKIYSILPMIMLVLMIFDSYFEMTAIVTFFWIILGSSRVDKKRY
ncbi:hypothetical protein [Clostridium sp. B9]|uniref:hypothetical protein n=1 Tax=Clostridium sp. B9 TaxID=3423224 RepID=UPI003D2F4A4A